MYPLAETLSYVAVKSDLFTFGFFLSTDTPGQSATEIDDRREDRASQPMAEFCNIIQRGSCKPSDRNSGDLM